MSRENTRRSVARNKVLLILAVAVFVAGLFLQITMLSRNSNQNKRASELEAEISRLNASAQNLELSINQYHNLENIAVQAQQLGMEYPSEDQIRVVYVARNENTSAQTAANFGGDEVLN